MILITGFLYAWFVQMILSHFGVQAGYWLCYGMVVLLNFMTSDRVTVNIKKE